MNQDIEIWKPILGYQDIYEVSSCGRIKSLHRLIRRNLKDTKSNYFSDEKLLNPWKNTNSYLSVTLRKDGISKVFRVHRIVAETFMGTCPENMEVCHKNGKRDDNRLENLRFDSRSNNHLDKINHNTDNRGEKHPLSKLSEIDVKKIMSMKDIKPIKEIANEFNISQRHIKDIFSKRRWKHLHNS